MTPEASTQVIPAGKRDGAPVFTVEKFGLVESGAFRRTKKRFEQLLDEVGRSPPRQVRPKMKCRPADRIKPRAVARAALQYRRNQPKNHDHDSLQS